MEEEAFSGEHFFFLLEKEREKGSTKFKCNLTYSKPVNSIYWDGFKGQRFGFANFEFFVCCDSIVS